MVIENIYTIFNFNFFKLITTLIPTLILTIMALMELLWAEKIIKHSNKIIAVIAIKEELGEYITIKVYIYIQEKFTDYTLWTIF